MVKLVGLKKVINHGCCSRSKMMVFASVAQTNGVQFKVITDWIFTK